MKHIEHPLKGDIVYVEDAIETDDYALDVMRYVRSHGGMFRPTTDEWRPNFPGELVQVGMSPRYVRHRESKFAESEWKLEYWRVFVQGLDAFNSTMSFTTPDYEKARRVYMSLPLIISKADLRSRGFIHE